MKNPFKSSKAKKASVAVTEFFAIILVIVFSLYLTGVNLNPFSEAGLAKNLTARLEGGVADTVSINQLGTYKVRIYNKSGAQQRGPFTLNATYCPPNVSRSNTRKIDSASANKNMGYCGSYTVDATRFLDGSGTYIGDLGRIATDSSKALPIGDYYLSFNNNSGISNEVIVRVGKLDMSQYWTFDTNSYTIFDGVNNEVRDASGNPTRGTVYTDYVAKEKICEKEQTGSIAWRIAGSNRFMYWNPDFLPTDGTNLVAKDNSAALKLGLNDAQRASALRNLSFNFSRMKMQDKDGSLVDYIGSNYWSSFLSTEANAVKSTSYSPTIENSFNPNATDQLVFNTAPVDSTKTYFPGGNLLYFPILLDMNDEYNFNSTSFFETTPGDPDTCAKLFGEKPAPAGNKAMHVINFFGHQDSKTKSYGVVISLKEVYPYIAENAAKDLSNPKVLPTNCKTTDDFWKGNCPTLLREDYYTTPGIGLTALRKDSYGYTRHESLKEFAPCNRDADCTRKGPIQNPAFSMTYSKTGKKTTTGSLTTVSQSFLSISSTSAVTNIPTPVTVTRQNISTTKATYRVTVNQNDPLLSKTESFQIILDEKGGYSQSACGANFSTTTKGGVRLMINNSTWKLPNSTATWGQTSNSSTVYYNSPVVTGKNACNAANSFCWYQNKTGSYTTDGGIKVSNITYQKSGNLAVVNFTVDSNIPVSRLNTYFFYQTTGAQQNNNRLSQTPDFYSNQIKACGQQLFNPVKIN